MVSFVCNYCQETIKKPKLDQHKQRCRNATFSCIDCGVDFVGNSYREHTSCISEDQKYMGNLYKQKKKNNKNNSQNNDNQNQQKKKQNNNNIAVKDSNTAKNSALNTSSANINKVSNNPSNSMELFNLKVKKLQSAQTQEMNELGMDEEGIALKRKNQDNTEESVVQNSAKKHKELIQSDSNSNDNDTDTKNNKNNSQNNDNQNQNQQKKKQNNNNIAVKDSNTAKNSALNTSSANINKVSNNPSNSMELFNLKVKKLQSAQTQEMNELGMDEEGIALKRKNQDNTEESVVQNSAKKHKELIQSDSNSNDNDTDTVITRTLFDLIKSHSSKNKSLSFGELEKKTISSLKKSTNQKNYKKQVKTFFKNVKVSVTGDKLTLDL
ncbi:hypothetical protein BB561_003666 [Smittium simulii]|uniref:Zinc finger C2H2 LYAR-type domain-containing protein n=1 Tax=Smittium simulii TaxID=133385 RepID=A0A2T9YK42_9FUNG|nr:hypothetical protein BB561_003666 [Smittium simulii]